MFRKKFSISFSFFLRNLMQFNFMFYDSQLYDFDSLKIRLSLFGTSEGDKKDLILQTESLEVPP
ncbi:hypothetical protein LB456_01945 [Psychroflexus sp. CAK57W]|uniref:hypothetical protein n=1 Tax=Psychroflexus curvus TaxID=2873595 RepID=UPI001CCCC8F6|nr:hypothetical protein [Psychroflexus curvus]MBZ9786209.1 hypothetical protein [Psychroflexus curvus]